MSSPFLVLRLSAGSTPPTKRVPLPARAPTKRHTMSNHELGRAWPPFPAYPPWPPLPPAPPPPPPDDWAGFLVAIVLAIVLLGVAVLGVVVCVVVPPRTSHLLDRFRPSVRLTFLGGLFFLASAACNLAGFVLEWQPRRGEGRGTGDGWYFADFSPVWLDRVWQGHEASAIPYLFGAAAATVAWACVWPSLANLALLCGGGGGRPGTKLLTTCFGAVIAISVLGLRHARPNSHPNPAP